MLTLRNFTTTRSLLVSDALQSANYLLWSVVSCIILISTPLRIPTKSASANASSHVIAADLRQHQASKLIPERRAATVLRRDTSFLLLVMASAYVTNVDQCNTLSISL